MPETDAPTRKKIIDSLADNEQVSKSYEFVAHAAALAIQDAVDNLRNINSICTTALGAILAQAVENPATADQCHSIAKTIQDISAAANSNFVTTTDNISRVLASFPRIAEPLKFKTN